MKNLSHEHPSMFVKKFELIITTDADPIANDMVYACIQTQWAQPFRTRLEHWAAIAVVKRTAYALKNDSSWSANVDAYRFERLHCHCCCCYCRAIGRPCCLQVEELQRQLVPCQTNFGHSH